MREARILMRLQQAEMDLDYTDCVVLDAFLMKGVPSGQVQSEPVMFTWRGMLVLPCVIIITYGSSADSVYTGSVDHFGIRVS
jgi:hypothetical protein